MKRVILFLLIALILTACGGEQLEIDPVEESDVLTADEITTEFTPSIESEPAPPEPTSAPETTANIDSGGISLEQFKDPEGTYIFEGGGEKFFTLIGMIPEEDMYLYGIKYPGVVLYHNGNGTYFDWSWTTPQRAPPQLTYHDFNGDGKEELILVFHTGSGNMRSMSDLRILQINEPEERWGSHTYTEYSLLAENIEEWLLEPILTNISKDGSLVINFMGEDYTVKNDEFTFTGELYYGNVVGFSFNDGIIKVGIMLFYLIEESGLPTDFGGITADVIFDGETLKLDNYEFNLSYN
ncbi:MAG: hypothetical protein FWG44_00480 [Oscillospiraceae bacterium]|nr:hypothetical protein [Oscillospiraceae bacterium]